MTDELKSVLAIALPVGVLLVGAMVIYGPGARLEGARSRARRRRGPRARRRRVLARSQARDVAEAARWQKAQEQAERAQAALMRHFGPQRNLGAASNDPRVYEVTYVEAWAPKRTTTARIVADTRLSKAELLAKLLERDVSPDTKIVKVRSEAI